MATFIRQPDGDILVRVRIKGYPTISRQFESKKETREWACVIEAEMRTGLWRNPSSARDTLLSDLIEDYIREVVPTRKSAHCINDETLLLRRIAKSLGQYSLATLSQRVIAAYRDMRMKTVAPAAVNRELAIITALLNWARREQEIALSTNVAGGCLARRPKTNNARNRRLSVQEEERLFHQLVTCKNPLVAPAVRLLLSSVMRCGEMLHVRRCDIDYLNHAIYLPEKKKGLARCVPMTLAAEDVLMNRLGF